MLRRFTLILAIVFPCLCMGATSKSDLSQRIIKAQELLTEMVNDSQDGIPREVIHKAKAVLFIEQIKAGFIVAIRGGQGLGLLHNPDGSWSAPAFYRVGGASVGFQAGGQRQLMVLFVMTDEGTRILTGNSGELGVDMEFAAGPIGRGKDLSNFKDIPVLVYTKVFGAYAGVSLKGSVLTPSKRNNQLYYNKPGVQALDILEGKVSFPAVAKPLANQLRTYAEEGK